MPKLKGLPLENCKIMAEEEFLELSRATMAPCIPLTALAGRR